MNKYLWLLLLCVFALTACHTKNPKKSPPKHTATKHKHPETYPALGDPREAANAAISRDEFFFFMVKDPVDDVWVVPSYSQGANRLQMENSGYPYFAKPLVENLPVDDQEKLKEYYRFAVIYNDVIMKHALKNSRRPEMMPANSDFDPKPPVAIRHPQSVDYELDIFAPAPSGVINNPQVYK